MSIKQAGLELQRTIWGFADRQQLSGVVAKLKSSNRGYGEQIYPVPVLGLLLFDQNRLRKIEGKAPVDELFTWSVREIELLFGLHEQIRRFNERCLAPLAPELPQCIDALNPYKRYPTDIESPEEFFFKTQEADQFVRKFHGHPAFEILLSGAGVVRARNIDYEQVVQRLDREIIDAGPGGKTEWVKNFEDAKIFDSENIELYRQIGAMLCLYNAIANVDELIYLGLGQSELINLDRSKVIDYMWTTAGPGPSMWLLHVPVGFMYIYEPTDLITVNIDTPGDAGGLGTKLCQISTKILPAGGRHPATLELRMIDNNLSAYPYLAQ